MLTPRWTPLDPHPIQLDLWNTRARFAVAHAGRRSGKTERAKRRLVMQALHWDGDHHANFAACAPTYHQAKRIYWEDLKALVPKIALDGRPNETELRINLKTGASIYVIGMDKSERIEGSPWDGLVLDEYGNMKPKTWELNVRPALADRNGWAWFVGVPEGRNHYYDLVTKAKADETGTWAVYHWLSADILRPEEILQAKMDLDEQSYAQEYEGAFLSFEGATYYAFTRAANVRPTFYRPLDALHIMFDFNIAPGVAAIAQEREELAEIIAEVHIPKGSNTPKVCERILDRFGTHQGLVYLYGDATGGSGGTAKIGGSDWDLILQALRPVFGQRLNMRVPRANPSERGRVATVNARLRNAAGEARLLIDPSCAHIIKDFEGVVSKPDGSIDKNKTPDLTHISDAIGYYLCERFPLVKGLVGHGGL